ncbi:phage tail spike protein [Caldifermentibacillus hisashii]|uniref:phage tail spike protein n=1 Tax=Caldifermentibacillus hisashii TaxID=996558 RepID=UPI0031FCAABE
MYEVTIYDGIGDKVGTVIHSPYPNDIKLSSGSIKNVLQGISNMSFSINLKNPSWGKIKPLKTLIKVRDVKRNKVIFNGRVLKPTQQMSSAGMFSISYECESIKAYLHDSHQRWGEYHNITVRDFLQVIIDNHNRQVESHKQFKLGNVTVTDSNDSLYRYLGYEDTYDTIKNKLLDRLGGYLIVREETDGNYIDYLESYGEVSNTPIRLRTNLKDMKREIDPLDVITRLIVLGETIESGDENNTEASQPRLTIASVNNGKDFLDDEEMIKEFGIIEGTIIYDDVTDPNTLLKRGQEFFANQKAAKVNYTLTPVDLNLLDESFDSYEVGNWYPIENPVFGIEGERLQVIEKNIDIINPTQMSLTVGEKYKTLTQYQVEANKKAKTVEQLQQTVSNQSQTIAVLKTEITAVDNAVKEVQQTIAENDIPALEQAVADLQTAIQNLNNAIGQIPTYGLATPTKDGLMPKSDKAKLNLITATKSVNLDTLKTKLDDLVRRVEVLEGGSN